MRNIINTNLKENVTLFGLFDSCFSGTILDLKYQYLDSLNYDKYTENDKTNDTIGNVIMISGCTDKQTSEDAFINNLPQGVMTWSFLENINSNITYRDLVKNMRRLLIENDCSQLPQISTGQIYDIDSKVLF